MEKSFEQFKKFDRAAPTEIPAPLANLVERLAFEAESNDSYEEVSTYLSEIEALQEFREKTKRLPMNSFYEVFEDVSNLNKALSSREEKERQLKNLLLSAGTRISRYSPRVADLYAGILAELNGEAFEPQFEATKVRLSRLKEEGDFDVLVSADTSWEMKLNRIEKSLHKFLMGMRALDKREGHEMDDEIREWREEQLQKSPTHPPERRNESKPGVDPMERLEKGERASAIWSIEPGVVGPKYFKEQSFSRWDAQKNVWVEDKYEYRYSIRPTSGG